MLCEMGEVVVHRMRYLKVGRGLALVLFDCPHHPPFSGVPCRDVSESYLLLVMIHGVCLALVCEIGKVMVPQSHEI